MTTRGLFVGRFQPLHQGHLDALASIEDRVDRLIVVIGSSQASHARENPFTAGERVWMLEEAFARAGIEATIVPVPDLNRNALWVHHVETYVPPFDVVFTNNALPRRLFAEAGYTVESFPLIDREQYEGTAIRETMRTGGDWEASVPDVVAEVIHAVDGVQRLEDLTHSDAADA